jgi:hypothetical protein
LPEPKNSENPDTHLAARIRRFALIYGLEVPQGELVEMQVQFLRDDEFVEFLPHGRYMLGAKVTNIYSITSSVVESSSEGMDIPNDLPVLRLMNNSTFVGSSTGRFAGVDRALSVSGWMGLQGLRLAGRSGRRVVRARSAPATGHAPSRSIREMR